VCSTNLQNIDDKTFCYEIQKRFLNNDHKIVTFSLGLKV